MEAEQLNLVSPLTTRQKTWQEESQSPKARGALATGQSRREDCPIREEGRRGISQSDDGTGRNYKSDSTNNCSIQIRLTILWILWFSHQQCQIIFAKFLHPRNSVFFVPDNKKIISQVNPCFLSIPKRYRNDRQIWSSSYKMVINKTEASLIIFH